MALLLETLRLSGPRRRSIRTPTPAPRATLAELLRWSAWVVLEPALADEHLALLTRLASQAPCYRLTLGPDMFDDRDLLQEPLP